MNKFKQLVDDCSLVVVFLVAGMVLGMLVGIMLINEPVLGILLTLATVYTFGRMVVDQIKFNKNSHKG